MINILLWIFVIFLGFLLTPFLNMAFMLNGFIYLYLYKLINGHKYSNLKELYSTPLRNIAKFLNYQARFFNGYEIHGLDNIPDGPAILLFYHSHATVDLFYAASRILLEKNRKVIPIIEKDMLGKIGFGSYIEAVEGTAGTVDSCVETLNNGNLLLIAPGGSREMLFGDSNYNLIWGERKGFAKVAINAKVPIIPVFTQNCRELTYTPEIYNDSLRKFYEKIKFRPFFGWFPVKLRTFIGKPIEYKSNRTVDELVKESKQCFESLISQHQRIPGSIIHAIGDHFRRIKND